MTERKRYDDEITCVICQYVNCVSNSSLRNLKMKDGKCKRKNIFLVLSTTIPDYLLCNCYVEVSNRKEAFKNG